MSRPTPLWTQGLPFLQTDGVPRPGCKSRTLTVSNRMGLGIQRRIRIPTEWNISPPSFHPIDQRDGNGMGIMPSSKGHFFYFMNVKESFFVVQSDSVSMRI